MQSATSRHLSNVASLLNDKRGRNRAFRLPALTFALFIALSNCPAAAQSCVQPPSGAIAWWSLDETSGNIAVDRIGGHTGSYANNPVPAPGEVRGALRFNGTNYVEVQDSDDWAFGANNFTIELWANFDTPPGGSIGEPGDIFIGNDEGPGNRNKWFFAVGGGYLYFHINSPTLGPMFFPLVPFSPTVGQWYHLAVVRRGSTYTVFINGVPSGTATNANVIPNPNAPLTIGEAESIGFVKGRLDEVTIYNRALAPEEIMAIFNAGTAGKCESLSIQPSVGGDTGNVSVQIISVGFEQGATVKLSQSGQQDIVGTPVTVSIDGTSINTTFALSGQPRGLWDVVVTNPDQTFQTLPHGFTIEAGTEPQVWVDIVGIDFIVPGRAQTFHIFYGNSGNVDAIGVPLWIAGIPPDATLRLGFSALPPLPVGDPPVDYSQVPTFVNTGTEIEAGFVMSVMPAGSAGALQISITIPVMENFQLRAWTNPPWFESSQQGLPSFSSPLKSRHPRSRSCKSRRQERLEYDSATSDFLNCGLAILNEVYKDANRGLGDCEESLLGTYQEFLVGLGTREPANLGWSITNAAFQCGLASACDLCVEGHLTPSCVVCVAVNIEGVLNDLYDGYNNGRDCANAGIQVGETVAQIVSIFSLDPNDIVGSQGVGTAQYVSGQQPLRYSIFFENSPIATAPVQQAVITDQLDATKVDLTTLSLGPISFGTNQVVPPPDESTFAGQVDLRPAMDLLVDITGSLNPNTGLLTWRLTSIDPAIGNPPTDPRIGFLPPDHNPPEGDGSVLFTVMPRQGLPTNTQIQNQTTIIFDENPPMNTPTWLNTLDNTPPTSQVAALPGTELCSNFTVQWSGTDVGAGIASYTTYVSDNGGTFTAWQTNTTSTSAVFNGQVGHSYGFYSIAADLVGNVESGKSSAEATTQVNKGTICGPIGPPTAMGDATIRRLP